MAGFTGNGTGQLGDGTTVNKSSPIQIGSMSNWKQVVTVNSSGTLDAGSTIAIKTDGTLWAWGGNGVGQLGDGTTIPKSSPVQIGTLTNWKQIGNLETSGGTIGVIKTDNTLWTWGAGGSGVLGNGTTINYSSPVQIGSLTNWKQISIGYSVQSLAVKTDGTLWAWGSNVTGALGNGTTVNTSSPLQIGSLSNWKQISAGQSASMAITFAEIT